MQTKRLVARRSGLRARRRPLAACLALLLSLAFAALAQAQGSARDVELRLLPPAGAVSGYRAHLVPESTLAPQVVDLGPVSPGADGIVRGVVSLDAAESYAVAVTAYNAAGESPLSNSIRIEALPGLCDPSLCDDGNACTADACADSACVATPVPDGTSCDDGLATTTGDRCVAGTCRGSTSGFSLQSVTPSTVATGRYRIDVRGTGYQLGARLSFANGSGPLPVVQSQWFADTSTIRAWIKTPTRSSASRWDVVVTLPDGRSARLVGGLRVSP
jgi:hypothetical protein